MEKNKTGLCNRSAIRENESKTQFKQFSACTRCARNPEVNNIFQFIERNKLVSDKKNPSQRTRQQEKVFFSHSLHTYVRECVRV